jgi:hypothetical protein
MAFSKLWKFIITGGALIDFTVMCVHKETYLNQHYQFFQQEYVGNARKLYVIR